MLSIQESLSNLVENGVAAVAKKNRSHSGESIHFYKCSLSNKYTLLFFNTKGDLKQPVPEKRFDDKNEAIDEFIKLTGLGSD